MSAASTRAHEPSMEEILASIRRIIADDQDEKPGTGSDEAGDVLDLAARAAAPAPAEPERAEAPPVGRPARLDLEIPESDLSFSEPDSARPVHESLPPPAPGAPAPEQEPLRAPAPLRDPAPAIPEHLISTEATASVGHAFNALSHTVLTRNARTLEDLVKEMLKPMLKVWLDDNLPPLVERLVRAEIERVARGRG